MEETLKEFKKLLETSAQLMSPEGCPWDREQTFASMRGSLLEEAYEVLEALDTNNLENLVEELGDLLYNVIFFCEMGMRDAQFELKTVIAKVCNKLIERHPHVFGEKAVHDAKSVLEQWERIKNKNRASLMDGIPKTLPALARAHKMVHKLRHAKYESVEIEPSLAFNNDLELGELLWSIVVSAKEKGLNAEHALREKVFALESEFRLWEEGKKNT